MKILVTGGTGYIGSHTVVELQNRGIEVVIIDNLSNSDISVVDAIEKITGIKPHLEILDLTDRSKTLDFIRFNNDLDGVIHFAAAKAVGESVEKPLFYYFNNLLSLINVMDGMIENGIRNFVFSSSCTVYGQPDKLPVSEKSPVKKAESPYGNTKQVAEEIILDATKVTALKAIALRYFNPIGAHESALIGELPIGVPNNLVPFITQAGIGLREQLKVFGDDYSTPDGTAIRDYIHVVDLAKAHVLAISRMTENHMKRDFEVFNLGTGNGYSVMEVIKSFEKISGLKLNYKIVDRREGDVEQVWADPTFSNQELGWKAEKNLDEMMLSAWNWEKNFRKKE
jgi:UDP-glucose 4-epimerase